MHRWIGKGPKGQKPSSRVPSKGRCRYELEGYSVGQTWEEKSAPISHLSRMGAAVGMAGSTRVSSRIGQCLLELLWLPLQVCI